MPQLPHAKTCRERAEECRKLANIAPEHMKARYLQLAAPYEELG
jgi:hypothetical protein